MDDIEEDLDENDNDLSFVGKLGKKRAKKVDVMGPIAATADRLGLSVRARCMIVALVANTLNVDIENTNISKSSAHEMAN